MNNFTMNIWDSIERFSYNVWIIKRVKNITCTCVDHETKQATNSCPKCFGTGNKVKLYRTKAVLREGKEQEAIFSDSTVSNTPKMGYFKYGIIIEKNDYVIDKEDIYSVFTKQYLRGEDGEPNTIKCTCSPIKMDSKIIIKNLKEVLASYGYKI